MKEKLSKDEHFDADSQLQNVEESFTVANEALYDLKILNTEKETFTSSKYLAYYLIHQC